MLREIDNVVAGDPRAMQWFRAQVRVAIERAHDLPEDWVDTIEGKAALLARLHDYCLCFLLEPENPLRIIEDAEPVEALLFQEVLFLSWAKEGRQVVTPDQMARRWELVRRKMNHDLLGWPGDGGGTGPTSVATNADGSKPKGGRPKVSEAEARKRQTLCDDWNQAKIAGTSQKVFCQDHGVTLNYLQKALNWDTQRRRRETPRG